MKFAAPQPAIVESLTWAMNAIAARPANPSLSGVRIEAQQGMSRWTGFDYESMASITTTVDTDAPGTIVTPARATLDIVKGLPKSATVTLEATEEGRLRITAGRSQYEVPLIPIDQYPKVPELPETVGTVDGAEFGEAVKRVATAAANDHTIPTLTALHITHGGGFLDLEATDKYRVHNLTVEARLTAAEDASWLVRADRINGRVPANGEVQLLADDTRFGVRTGNRAFTTLVTDGDYPKVRSLWPRKAAYTVAFDRDEMVQAVTAIDSVVERNLPVILNIAPGEVVLNAGSHDGGQGTEYVSADTGDTTVVAYNPQYLRAALNAVDGPTVTLSLNDGRQPTTITGTSNARALLMPKDLPRK